jgi:hypothetical protein
MLIPDFSVSVAERRATCILEPSLMLSAYGLPLARRLAGAMNLWVVRELWHILDNSQLFLQRPALLFGDAAAPSDDQLNAATRALQDWERLRQDTDLNGLRLYWLFDSVAESKLPAGLDGSTLARFDFLCAMLDSERGGDAPIKLAVRDSIALAATLGGALLLTALPLGDNARPMICSLLEGELDIRPVPQDDQLMAIERQYLRELLVHAGAAGLLWDKLRLAVIRVAAPAAEEAILPDDAQTGTPSPWAGARAYWYPL